jgi:hypothetical protein
MGDGEPTWRAEAGDYVVNQLCHKCFRGDGACSDQYRSVIAHPSQKTSWHAG